MTDGRMEALSQIIENVLDTPDFEAMMNGELRWFTQTFKTTIHPSLTEVRRAVEKELKRKYPDKEFYCNYRGDIYGDYMLWVRYIPY